MDMAPTQEDIEHAQQLLYPLYRPEKAPYRRKRIEPHMTYQEIAEALGTSENSVRRIEKSALAKIRRYLSHNQQTGGIPC